MESLGLAHHPGGSTARRIGRVAAVLGVRAVRERLMDAWAVTFCIGFVLGLTLGLWWGWGQRKRAIEAEKTLHISLGQIAARVKR